MSSYNDYLVASNNSINDNKVNLKKSQSTVHQLKKLVKPIFAILRKARNTYKKSVQPNYFTDDSQSESDDNLANDLLEAKIFEEIDDCENLSAVPVYNDGQMDILQVFRGQRYIPVHFARTDAGTFFWTSMVAPDHDITWHGDKNPITTYQTAELQVPSDRWAQA